MPSVVFWSGVPGGTGQYRCFAPGEAMRRAGWDVSYVETETDSLVADVVVFGRVISEIVPGLIDQLHARTDSLVVYDIDDWFDDVPDYNPAHEVELWQVHEAMKRVDLITVSTPGLAKLYQRFAPTAVLPNYLDPAIWSDLEEHRMAHPGLVLGWLAAYKWRGGDIEVLRPWLPQFLEDHPEVTFAALGCPELLDDLGIQGISVPLLSYEFLPKMLGTLDIGLAPLTFNAFNWRGKSACKSMEYGAMGVPSIASPSEANTAYIRPGLNGQLVRKNDWVRRVEMVMDDLDNYRLGARKVAEEWYIDEHIGAWIDAYARARRH